MLLISAIEIAAGYLFIVLILYFAQGYLLYKPTREIEFTPSDSGLSYKEIFIKTKDGIEICAWYVPATESKGTILFCHGNGGNISHRIDTIKIFNSLGLNVLIFDYRGYGKSKGAPSERGTYLDAEAAWDYLKDNLKTPSDKIIIFGRSLGGAVAVELALRRPSSRALIIESSFTSTTDMGKKMFPYLPIGIIARYRYSTLDKIDKIKMPKLVIHSPDDEIIPYSYGEEIFKKASEPKGFLRIRGGHNDGFWVSGSLYTEGIRGFIEENL